MSCPDCPCPGRECPRVYCDWAALRPPDEVKLRHIRVKMGCGDTPALALAVAAPEPRPAGLRRELVVCRYREDLDWLDDLSADIFVSVLDKSDEPYRVRRQSRRERLPNVGRESHSMLSHIVAHRDDLAEWTYFVQGDAPSHAPDIIGRLGVAYDDACSLTETYSASHPPDWIRGHDLVERHGGFAVRYGDAAIQMHDGAELVRPWFNPSAWSYVFLSPRPSPLWFGYGAMYAVPRRRILARPPAFWAWLLAEAVRSPWQRDEHTDPPLTPWQFEALWYYLLSDPADHPHRPPPPAPGDLLRGLMRCPFRSRDAGCGCSGARCALRGGAAVPAVECVECVRTYD